MSLPWQLRAAPRNYSSIFLALGQAHGWCGNGIRALHVSAVGALAAAFFRITTREEIYNVLWALVFGFATLNIMSLGARRLDAQKRGLNFGVVLAVLIVAVSIILLAWEMLYVFHILPIRLAPR